MFTDETLQNIEKILTFLEEKEIEFVIAGGFPRDLAHSVRPKDIDIFIITNLQGAILGNDLSAFLYSMEGKNKPCSGEGNPNIYNVIGVKLGDDLDADVIFMRDNIKTQEDVLATFDFNINQYVLEKDGDGDYSNPVFKGEGEKSLMIVNRENKPKRDRKIKILQKANGFGWKFPYITLERVIPY